MVLIVILEFMFLYQNIIQYCAGTCICAVWMTLMLLDSLHLVSIYNILRNVVLSFCSVLHVIKIILSLLCMQLSVPPISYSSTNNKLFLYYTDPNNNNNIFIGGTISTIMGSYYSISRTPAIRIEMIIIITQNVRK